MAVERLEYSLVKGYPWVEDDGRRREIGVHDDDEDGVDRCEM